MNRHSPLATVVWMILAALFFIVFSIALIYFMSILDMLDWL